MNLQREGPCLTYPIFDDFPAFVDILYGDKKYLRMGPYKKMVDYECMNMVNDNGGKRIDMSSDEFLEDIRGVLAPYPEELVDQYFPLDGVGTSIEELCTLLYFPNNTFCIFIYIC